MLKSTQIDSNRLKFESREKNYNYCTMQYHLHLPDGSLITTQIYCLSIFIAYS